MYNFDPIKITDSAKALFKEERAINHLEGWFILKEKEALYDSEFEELPPMLKFAKKFNKALRELPLSISDNALFAGTQRDAFARSYALINPSFKVETFAGYCDPTAVYGDIDETAEFTKERISALRKTDKNTPYVKALTEVYASCEKHTGEVAYFIEQVTGHLIPDMRYALKHGVLKMMSDIDEKISSENDPEKLSNYEAMKTSLDSCLLLAKRYENIALKKADAAEGKNKEKLLLMAKTLEKVPAKGAETLYEAIQSFIILWEIMCLEQAPNPFAFSVGNADRIFEPYRAGDGLSREETAALLKHFLVFFNVADRSWAISQNLIVSGRDENGNDLTNDTTYALLDAYYDMNLPQPILSVKLHKNTPEKLYKELGRFLFTPGMLTPSFFNDDSLFEVLPKAGIDTSDVVDTAIAGCQEPLIMGKDNGNTTNSWFNLGKILELTLNDGYSTVTGKEIGTSCEKCDALTALKNIRERFYKNAEYFCTEMVKAANGASRAISHMPVPFLSTVMGGIKSGYDVRDIHHQGTKYNGSGCLIHGVSVVADSFIAIDKLIKERPEDAERLLEALKTNFENDEELRQYLLSAPKFGNNIKEVDDEAVEVTNKIADMVRSKKNYLGNNFRPDFSTPSTHLLYGYWVGALPCGRKSRDMLNYGLDPLYGEAQNGLGFRTLSIMKLPFIKMCGGYASHFGIDPKYFTTDTYDEKGLEFRDKVIKPLFFNPLNDKTSPFYLYVNVTTAEILRKVLAEPEKYAPSGVYIMRIHGTFVNFLDLSPAIQQDIIRRLDPKSTCLC